MPEPPEVLFDTATPEQILNRLDFVREQYRMGLMDAATFNAAMKEFQFPDDAGVLWAPGAQSNRWYRWERGQWTLAAPPAKLNLRLPVALFREFAELLQHSTQAATSTPVSPQPPTPPSAQAPSPASAPPAHPMPRFCPQCGIPAAGRFCTACGNQLG